MKGARNTFKVACMLVAATVLSACQATPRQPSARALLDEVGSTYRTMKTFSAKAKIEMEMSGSGMSQKMDMPVTIAADSSGKYREESTGAVPMVFVFDGDVFWLYMPQFKEYDRLSLEQLGSRIKRTVTAGITIPEGYTGTINYSTVAANVKRSQVLRSQTLQPNGSALPCWVISVEYEPVNGKRSPHPSAKPPATILQARTLWVDKSHYLVYQDTSSTKIIQASYTGPTVSKTTIQFNSITVDKPLPANEFTFAPPPGATRMHFMSLLPKALHAK